MIVHNTSSLRTEVVININSPTFLNGGALRVGDYKLMVEWNATVHNTVSEVMVVLSQSQTLRSRQYIHGLVEQAMGSPSSAHKYLINIAMNPSERTDGHCTVHEACSNL